MVHDPHRNGPAAPGQVAASAAGGERVAKALARAGVASRREVERLIAAGRVALNGQLLTTPAVKVDAGDVLTVDGRVVNEPEPARLFRYHKPPGLVTTHKDPQGRPTVFETLPKDLPRLISVGRLDLNSEGLLLLTNDGGLARALELPATGLVRRYRARARGRISQARLDRLKDGITVEGVHYGPIEASLDKAREGPQGANLWITLTLAEGKNREVRRVLEALGLRVNRLIRLAYGPFALGALAAGDIEEVGPRVIREQLAEFIAPQNLPKGERAQWRQKPLLPSREKAPAEPTDEGSRRQPAKQSIDRSRRREAERPVKSLIRPASQATFSRKGRRDEEAETKPKKAYKAGWAKPKPKRSGSRPGGGPSAGPRGPRPSASPPRSSGARPPGPRPGGGRGRRG
ncbi:MAG TPA: pseudouridine synthase [Phenylobacterium sp.]|uniref:pseudouridine synthase n=1 Tax=Phenylobacterium sp. TaxID=1871053 RepID=UPI002BE0AEB3|nr:pseudouridine synthase [Phenylobacterium sp.]HSV03790.1 pseudouridine synthase [Phenylobacterium sp.]